MCCMHLRQLDKILINSGQIKSPIALTSEFWGHKITTQNYTQCNWENNYGGHNSKVLLNH